MLTDQLLKMSDVMLTNRRVLIREDLNVPLEDGKIVDDTRIQRALPTLKLALEAGAKVMVMSHLGRPKEGEFDQAASLLPVAKALSNTLNCKVELASDYLDGVDIKSGQIVLLENIRFNAGEKSCDNKLSQQYAKLCDVFVMDAFATAHRSQASTTGVAEYAPVICAGPLLIEELRHLTQALENPQRPLAAIVGGSKVSTKMRLIERLLGKVDKLIVGGGIANTFLKAAGFPIGASLYEADYIEQTKVLLDKAEQNNIVLPLPIDVAVATEFKASAKANIKAINDVGDDELILDVGPGTAAHYATLLTGVATIVWNGPLGVCEFPEFSHGTHELAKAVAASAAYSIAGGGDTLAVLNQFGLQQEISYICTGGGAFLAFLENGSPPAVDVLLKRAT